MPDPPAARAINTDVAFIMMFTLGLEFDIRLTGLRSAAHLNGREGVICDSDSGSPARWTVLLDDGTYVSVKAGNFLHVRRGGYKRRSP